MSLPIGIVLGRLTPSKGRGIQFYPYGENEWENEFHIASQLGLSHIEWVWDEPENPLLDKEFRARVRTRIAEKNVPVRGVDVQFFAKSDVAHVTGDQFKAICEAMADIDGEAIDVPFLEQSSMLTDKERMKKLLERLAKFLDIAASFDLNVNLESDLPAKNVKALIEVLPDLGVCYDTGNSHNEGYYPSEEWDAYGVSIRNVQVKDRPRGGSTMPLGKGGTDFHAIFTKAKEKGYTGPVTLQAARGEDGHEVETVKGYMEFVNKVYESI